MDMRALVMDPVIDKIVKNNYIRNEQECDLATYFVEKCSDVFDLPKQNPFRQKVSKILDLIEKFNVEQTIK